MTIIEKASKVAEDCALFLNAQEEIEVSDINGPRITEAGIEIMAKLIAQALDPEGSYPEEAHQPTSNQDLPAGFLPAEQVKTCCADCNRYIRWPNIDDVHCIMAKTLGRHPITGAYVYEKNEDKNQGNCADYEPKENEK